MKATIAQKRAMLRNAIRKANFTIIESNMTDAHGNQFYVELSDGFVDINNGEISACEVTDIHVVSEGIRLIFKQGFVTIGYSRVKHIHLHDSVWEHVDHVNLTF